MQRKLIYLYFIFAFNIYNISSIVYPSIRYAITNENLGKLEGMFIKEFFENKTIYLEDIYISKKIEFVGEIQFELTNISLYFNNINTESLKLFFDDNNTFSVSLLNGGANLSFAYKFKSSFYSNTGNGKISMYNTTIKIINKIIKVKNEKDESKYGPGYQIEQLQIPSSELEFSFDHEGGLEKIFEFLLVNLKIAILQVIEKKFEIKYKPQLNQKLINKFKSEELIYPIGDDDLFLSYSMNEDPYISSKGMEMSFEGEIISQNCSYFGYTYNIPHITKINSIIDIHISQSIFEDLFYVLYKKGKLNFVINSDTYKLYPITIKTFSEIFPGLYDKYQNYSLPVNIHLTSYNASKIEFYEGKSMSLSYKKIDLYVQKTNFLTKLVTEELFVSFLSDIESDLDFSLKKGKFTADIKEMTFKNFRTLQSLIGEINEELALKKINDLFNTYLSIFNLLLNSFLNNIKFPSIRHISFNQTDLFIHPKYLHVGLTPYINESISFKSWISSWINGN